MLDSDYLNDLWKQVNVEDPDRIPAEDVKKVLEELRDLRHVTLQNVKVREQLTLDTITVERCLSNVELLVNASRDVAMMVGAIPNMVKEGEPEPTVPMKSTVAEAQEAIARVYRFFNLYSSLGKDEN